MTATTATTDRTATATAGATATATAATATTPVKSKRAAGPVKPKRAARTHASSQRDSAKRATGKRPARGLTAAELDMDSDEEVRVSQIDTTVQFSQRTLLGLFGSDSDEAELSQAAVPRAFGRSQSEVTVDASQQVAAASLQLLPEASGLGSESEPPAVATPTATNASSRVLRPRVKRDVNFVSADERLSDYESFSSGDSDGQDNEEGDESPLYTVDSDDDEDVLSNADAVQMDGAFMEALQIENDALSKAAKKAREAALRAMEWTPVSSEFECDVTAYDGLGADEAHPVAEPQAVCHSPLETFFYFMPKSLWVLICAESNRYNLQQVNRCAVAMQAKQAALRRKTVPQICRRLKAKPAYETHEILHVVGLLIARMLCGQDVVPAEAWLRRAVVHGR
jgi:hypothetical protein